METTLLGLYEVEGFRARVQGLGLVGKVLGLGCGV